MGKKPNNENSKRIKNLVNSKEMAYQVILKGIDSLARDYDKDKQSILAGLINHYLDTAEQEIYWRCLDIVGKSLTGGIMDLVSQKKKDDLKYYEQLDLELQWNPMGHELVKSKQKQLEQKLRILSSDNCCNLLKTLYSKSGQKTGIWIDVNEDLVNQTECESLSTLKKDLKDLDKAGFIQRRFNKNGRRQQISLTKDTLELFS